MKICVQAVGRHSGRASKQPPGHSPGNPNSRPTALPQLLLEEAAGVPTQRQLKLAEVVITNWSHEQVPCWTFVGQQCCHNMSLDDTHYLTPGGKTFLRAVFPHPWIGFLNRASQVRILPGPHQEFPMHNDDARVYGSTTSRNSINSTNDGGWRGDK